MLDVSNSILCSSSGDEQSILFETSRPQRLFSERTQLNYIHVVVPASLLVIVTSYVYVCEIPPCVLGLFMQTPSSVILV